ncbi:neuroblastoma suppressor of tumorigenicity 1-like isoform X2 [Eriocheir sinensis]|uniref:neuroblastoma suppressor of tumorigenicity 1-like isoform X2 n=1 Tax=Eriocheir sinensis TaxID=95602 RepID=UPI0021C8157D|nr:neuroblastoma suppressor of tumorigenicity 1-like isoform X2 [Eriocheir sinensis]
MWMMWCRAWVLATLAASAAAAATNDVFPVEEEAAPPPPLALPHAAGLSRAQNDVFPLEEEEEAPHHHKHGSRHHKVHNIVLHPQPNSLCELKPIRQIVTHALCTSKEMENHVCVGTCFSYTVPQTEPETPGDEMLDYCDSCQASESHWTTIQLDCEEYGNTYQVTKKIQMITNCSCSPCHPSRGQQPPMDNEVYPANENRVSDFFYKQIPDAPSRPDFSEALQLKKTSLDELRKSAIYQELGPNGKIVFKVPPSFGVTEDEEDPNDVVSF